MEGHAILVSSTTIPITRAHRYAWRRERHAHDSHLQERGGPCNDQRQNGKDPSTAMLIISQDPVPETGAREEHQDTISKTHGKKEKRKWVGTGTGGLGRTKMAGSADAASAMMHTVVQYHYRA